MVRLPSHIKSKSRITDNHPARPPRRTQHAHRSNHRLPLLHHLDSVHGTIPADTPRITRCISIVKIPYLHALTIHQPFVDEDHPLQSFFPPRVWAIRIPVILMVLFTTVVGSFLSVVMIRSNRKKALKAKQKKAT